jgi:hypothetical protein
VALAFWLERRWARVCCRASRTRRCAHLLPVVALIALQMLYTGVSQFLGH